ncbi:MAG: hypothetical protein GY696_36200, partial [Gammaproteobacteria bacterium]|nr:hypothetical protein [Gammaproteobacteria bacterium]
MKKLGMRLDIDNMTVAVVSHLPKPDMAPRVLTTPALSSPHGEEMPEVSADSLIQEFPKLFQSGIGASGQSVHPKKVPVKAIP